MPCGIPSSLQMLGCSLQTGCSRRGGTLSLPTLRPLSLPWTPLALPADLGPVGEPAPCRARCCRRGGLGEGCHPTGCHGWVWTTKSEVLGCAQALSLSWLPEPQQVLPCCLCWVLSDGNGDRACQWRALSSNEQEQGVGSSRVAGLPLERRGRLGCTYMALWY